MNEHLLTLCHENDNLYVVTAPRPTRALLVCETHSGTCSPRPRGEFAVAEAEE
jgi:hypothetical protein